MRRELIALALLATPSWACKRADPQPPGEGESRVGETRVGERGARPPLAEKAFYRLDLGALPACAPGAACEAKLVLTARAGYHVNERYPMKFVGEPSPGVALDGEGTFAIDNAQTGTLTVKYRADKAGTAKVTGTFKLSVCSDDNCEIESPKIAFDVTSG